MNKSPSGDKNSLAYFREVQLFNQKLEDMTVNLESRVDERTRELETVNQQLVRRAGQLQAVTELSETIAQVQVQRIAKQRAKREVGQRSGEPGHLRARRLQGGEARQRYVRLVQGRVQVSGGVKNIGFEQLCNAIVRLTETVLFGGRHGF